VAKTLKLGWIRYCWSVLSRAGRQHRRSARAATRSTGLAAGLLIAALSLFGAAPTKAQETRFFRIGTAAASGTYFPIGGMIANAISNPPGARDCDRGGSCGVPGLIAVAQATQGSVDNIQAIVQGRLESGLSQADVAYWAYTGTGTYDKPIRNLRAIASLFPELMHIVVRQDSDIRSLKDLKGKHVSLGERNSGTLVDARLVLDSVGLKETDVRAEYFKVAQAAQALREGNLDALILIAGYPVPAIAELVTTTPIALVPVSTEEAAALHRKIGYFNASEIPADSYPGLPGPVPTVAIHALWLTRTDMDDNLVYQITRALWHDNARRLFETGHPMAKRIRLQDALEGLHIPLHTGAERFYREVGMAISTPTAASD
jgi:TRAP transporter TAXI family solute receptor